MLNLERKTYILSKISEKGTVSLSDISKELNVSIATIRRDLDKLAEEGYVERVHGGAVLSSSQFSQNKYNKHTATVLSSEKAKLNYEEKVLIAKKAATYVKDGDCVFLDGSTTVAQMIDFLADKKISIVTPNVLVIDKIRELNCEFDVILVGGRYSIENESTIGPISEQQIQQFSYDIAFFGCSGIDFEKGIVYDDNSDTITLKMPAFIDSNKKILLADHSKLNKKTFFRFLETNKFDYIISDYKEPDSNKYPDNLVWANR